MLVALSLTFCSYSVAPAQLTEQLRSISERRKADDLLKRARSAMDDGNLALAEWYLDRVDKMEVKFDSVFGRTTDTPARLRESIAQAKANNRLSEALQKDGLVDNGQTIPQASNVPGDKFVPSLNPPTELASPPANATAASTNQTANPATSQPVNESPKAKAQRLLAKAWSALGAGEVSAAAGWYQNALACDAQFSEGEFSPAHLAAEFKKRGINLGDAIAGLSVTADSEATKAVEPAPKLLDPAALAVIQPESGQSTAPAEQESLDPQLLEADQITSSRLLERGATLVQRQTNTAASPELAQKRNQAVALLAQAQAALQRDDLAVAKRLIGQANEMKVPDSAYQAGDLRPWMLQMELDKVMKRVAAAGGGAGTNEPAVFSPPPIGTPNTMPVVEVVSANGPAAATAATARPSATAQQPAQNGPATPASDRPAELAANASTAHASAANGQTVINDHISQRNGASQARVVPSNYVSAPASARAQAVPAQYASSQPGTPQADRPQPVASTSQAPRAPVTGLVYDPIDDSTQNRMASGQEAIPGDAGSPAPPFAASPFPLEAPNTASDPATSFAMPTVDNGFDLTDSPPAQMAPGAQTNRSRAGTEPTLAEPTPAPTSRAPVVNYQDARNINEPRSPLGARETATPTYAPTADGDSPAYDLFNEGQEALVSQDFDKALQFFREAWKYESELDPEARQALQDNLQIVRSKMAIKDATREVDPVALAPTPEQQRAAEQFINELSQKQATVRALRQTNPTKAWDELKEMRESLAKAQLDDQTRDALITRVERQIDELEQYVESNRSRLENDARNQRILEEIDRRRAMRVRNQQQLAELVDEFNQLWDQQRFSEANVIAKKARELDPRNPVVQTLMMKATTARQIQSKLMRDQQFNDNAVQAWHSVERSATPMDDEDQMEFPHYWGELTKRRKQQLASENRRYTEVEREIRRALQTKVDVKFENMPLAGVIDSLAKMAGINAFLDPEGLTAEGVSSDTPVNIRLRKAVSLKSALNLILEPMHLSYVIQDEVLRITSEQVRDGDVYPEVYPVADLVIPVPDFYPSNNVGLTGAIREAYQTLNRTHQLGGYSTGALMQGPLTIMQNELEQPVNSNQSVLAQMSAGGMIPQMPGPGGTARLPGAGGGGAQADFETLIELIQTTVEPDSWEELGGEGAIDGFQGNLSLVVSQTQDVHEQIADLLEQLRRLQDLQVTIEVRFIALNDDFFERIGVDFDFDIDDNTGLNSQTDIPNIDDDGPNVTIGLDTAGTPTVDLDIPFAQDSFGRAIPQFGGFDANSAATIGFAILSDIEAMFLIQAVQGDTRTNVLQAPKVTLFNGQTASVQDQAQRPFVTSVIPVVGDFAAAQQPVITVLAEGTSLNVRAVVSQDRRFVRLDLVPFFSEIQDVDTFTFDGAINSDTGTVAVDPTDDTATVVNNALNSNVGTTVQLPTLAFTTVSTTVSVPDGGTILLGGIKRLREGRTEQGVPMLSKIPYVNRLFTNVGIGRETQSLMMMVTPRIIIHEEEEAKLLGTQ